MEYRKQIAFTYYRKIRHRPIIAFKFLRWESARRRLGSPVNMALVTARHFVKSSRRWKYLSTRSTHAHFAGRTSKDLCILLSTFFFNTFNCFSVKRSATGIWNCTGCKKVMAGGAYTLSTSAAATARSAIARLRKTQDEN